jgi:hypothetical protein
MDGILAHEGDDRPCIVFHIDTTDPKVGTHERLRGGHPQSEGSYNPRLGQPT